MTIKYFFLLSLLTLWIFSSGCRKKNFNVEYIVENNSQRKLNIFIKKIGQSKTDSNLIASGQSLIFLIESGEDQSSKEFLQALDSIPVEFISITDIDDNHLTWDEQELSHWNKHFFDAKKNSTATMTSRIRERDFE